VRLKLGAVRLDKTAVCILVALPRGREQRRGRYRFGCQKATSPPAELETTLRHPAGPSRGSNKTVAPSRRARSVNAGT
jgi:hypothetical protein